MVYSENINLFPDDFNMYIFEDEFGVQSTIEGLCPQLIREVNELWKFMYFMFSCLRHVSVGKECFTCILDAIQGYCETLRELDLAKFNTFFKTMFLKEFVSVYRDCEVYEKKVHTAKLLYGFFAETPEARYEAIECFKSALGDLGLYIQTLGIFSSYETGKEEDIQVLIRNYQFYSAYSLGSSQPSLRLSGLVILSNLVNLDFQWSQERVLRILGSVNARNSDDVRMMYLIVLAKVMRKLVNSDEYQKLGKRQNINAGRTVNPGEDLLLKEIKATFERISECFADVLRQNYSTEVTKIALINYADLIIESKGLTSAYVDIILKAEEKIRTWSLNSTPGLSKQSVYLVYTKDGLKYDMDMDSGSLKKSAGEILAELAKKMKGISAAEFGHNHLDLLIFCYENAEFDKLNTEILDSLINNTLALLLNGMKIADICSKCSKVISKYFEVSLKGDTMISEFEMKLGDMISSILDSDEKKQVDNTKSLVHGWIKSYGEESAYYDQFTKYLSLIAKKALGSIKSQEHKKWIESLVGYGKENDKY